MKKGHFRGHPIIYIGEYPDNGKWVYEDTGEDLPATGGEARSCKECGLKFPLGEGEHDPCLGILPGVDNACCGHGVRDLSYIRFTNGVVISGFKKEFVIEDKE